MTRLSSVLLLAFVLSANLGFAKTDGDILQSFEKHLTQMDVKPATISSAKETLESLKSDSVADAITETLILLYPKYESAIEATDEDEVQAAIELLSTFTESEDKFLAADASFYLARTLMNDERFEEALPLIRKIGRELDEYSVHLPTIQYYRGVAQEGLLMNDEAISSFMEFLQFNPDASERLRVNAWRKVQQLQAIGKKKIDQVQLKMDYSRRRLKLAKSNDQTQDQQKKIVKLLSQLIKEQQKKECSKCNSKSPNTKKQQQQQQQKKQKKSNKSSKSQTGGTSNNANGTAQKRTYDDSPASPWSRLRDRSRDPANNALKEKLPAKYRDIVNRYYEKANGNESKGNK